VAALLLIAMYDVVTVMQFPLHSIFVQNCVKFRVG